MIEHRYPEGNRLTLTLLEALGTSPDPARIGAAVVSIYEQSGGLDCKAPYVVRGHVVTGVWIPAGYESRVAHAGLVFSTLDEARKGARTMFAELSALVRPVATAGGDA